MKNHEDNRRPEEIEHDIEQTRAQLSSNIDAIQSKLTPGQMMDQAISYARTSLPADFGSNLNRSVRDNPLPVTLVGIGLAWLMMSNRQKNGYADRYATGYNYDHPHRPGAGFAEEHGIDYAGHGGGVNDHGVGGHVTGDHDSAMHRATSSMSDTSHNMKNRASEMSRDLKHRASETSQSAKHRASETSQSMKHRASEAGHGLKERASGATQSLKSKASELGSRFSDTTSSASDRAREMADGARARASDISHRSQEQYYRTRSTVSHMAEEQPLMLGALGVAMGTLLGALLPATRREDEMMGDTRDQLVDQAKQTAREQADTVKQSAQRVAETAKESAQHVAETAKQEAKHTASQVSSSSESSTDGQARKNGSADEGRPGAQLH